MACFLFIKKDIYFIIGSCLWSVLVKEYARKILIHPTTMISIINAIKRMAALAKILRREIWKIFIRKTFSVIPLIINNTQQTKKAKIIISRVIIINDLVTSR
jgi:hypothetical protein